VGVEVPLVMCEGAPPGVLESLNGFSVWRRVDKLLKERPGQPALWTENWPGWYDVWGQPHHRRRTSELAYEILRFVGHGGTGVNYYMWHGGTNFDRDAMFLATTSYDFDAPLDEYGLPTDKSQRLTRLHRALRRVAPFLLGGRRLKPELLVPGEMPQHADGVVLHPYRLRGRETAILVNGNDWPQTVTARGVTIRLPSRSGVILEGNGRQARIVYRTWETPAAGIRRVMRPEPIRLTWEMVTEPVPDPARFRPVRLPHNMLNETHDETDFGWYRTSVSSPRAGTVPLRVPAADFLAAWVNGEYVGVTPGRFREDRQPADFLQTLEVPLRRGVNELLLLVTAIGLIKGDWMINAPQSEEAKGLLGKVRLDGRSITTDWKFAAGLWGESARLFNPRPAEVVRWRQPRAGGMPLRWYRSTFRLTAAQLVRPEPWAVAVGGLCRGRLWINGQGLGRYWQAPACNALESEIGCHPALLVDRFEQPIQTEVILEEEGALPVSVGLCRRI
jgi:hypothetical protein